MINVYVILIAGRNFGRRGIDSMFPGARFGLVAPSNIVEHAKKTGFALLDFERNAGLLPLGQAKASRQDNAYLGWDHAESFVTVARRDLKVEPLTLFARRRG